MPAGLNHAAQPLFEHLPDIAARVRACPHALLFLDYDGTLAPITEDPGQASMPELTRRALTRLLQRDKFSVAIISGRALPDLRERVRIEELIFAGNHGLEISAPEMHYIEPSAARCVDALEELSRHLHVRLQHIPGVDVEHKVLTASVHFRRAADGSIGEIHKTVQGAVAPLEALFQITPGLKLFEIRPRIDWHKGSAVRWILRTAGKADALPLYLGDDTTDEDAFGVLPEGITVRVGRTPDTCAQYSLRQQESVQEFLVWLSELQ